MRIASGTVDKNLAFVAVDATDLKTRETGLSGFTVYRSRNGATPVLYTTPTIVELSAANMPGVYVLTVDEDTTIAAGADEEEYVVHITHASMAPVTRAVELFRPKATLGNTLDVTSTGGGGIDWSNVEAPTTTLNLSGTTVKTATDVETDTQDIQSRLPAALGANGNIKADVRDYSGTAGTFSAGRPEVNTTHLAGSTIQQSGGYALVDTVKISGDSVAADNAESFFDGTGYAGTNNVIPTVTTVTNQLTAAQIATGVWRDSTAGDFTVASSIGKSLYTGVAPGASGGVFIAGTNATLSITAAATLNIVGNITGNLSGSVGSVTGLTNATIADAVWDEVLSGHLTAGTTGAMLNTGGTDPWNVSLPGSYAAGTAGKIVGDNLNATVSSRATQTSVDTVDDFLDTEIAAIKAVTDAIPNAGALTTIQADLDDIQSRLPAALGANGNIKADVRDLIGTAQSAADLKDFADDGYDPSTNKVQGVVLVDTITTYTGNTPQTGDSFARIGAAGAGLTAVRLTAAGIDDILDEAVDGTVTLRQSARLWNSAMGGKISGAATASVSIRDLADTKDRIVADVDADGNRSSITRDLS